jgi:hypothetical protein
VIESVGVVSFVRKFGDQGRKLAPFIRNPPSKRNLIVQTLSANV